MTYNASSEHVSQIIKLSAEIVVGLGTSLTGEKAIDLFNALEKVLEELDIAETQPSGRYERALVKAADRAVQRFSFAYLAGDIQANSNVADERDELNFEALSKALMAFDTGEAKSVVDLMLPTLYIWKEPLPEGTPVPSGDEPGQLYFRIALFNKGRPIDDPNSRLCRPFYKTREDAIYAVDADNFGGVVRDTPYQIVEGEAPKPYLYILMRNDLASLNAGKAVAQGTHAANQMVGELRKQAGNALFYKPDSLITALNVWEKEANHFGTCIVLAVNEAQMRASVAKALGDALPSHAGICHDPTYPLLDGKTLHLIPVDTCAYVFDYPARAKRHLVGYPLMP